MVKNARDSRSRQVRESSSRRRPERQRAVPSQTGQRAEKSRTGGSRRRAVLRLVLVITVVVLVVVFGPLAASVGALLWRRILEAFGLGLILLLIALGVLVRLIWSGFGPLVRHFNVFLGAALLGAAVWGVLGFLRPAGSIFWTVTLGRARGQGDSRPDRSARRPGRERAPCCRPHPRGAGAAPEERAVAVQTATGAQAGSSPAARRQRHQRRVVRSCRR